HFSVGALDDQMRRLFISPYLNLRTLFSRSIEQIREARNRLATTGSGGMVTTRVRTYQNPQRFIRQGWSPNDDILRIAMGEMQQRSYVTPESPPPTYSNTKIQRDILLLVDCTGSMQEDARGNLRNVIVGSYVDQIFTQAALRDEKVTVWV